MLLHCDVTAVVLNFDKDDSVVHENDEICLSTASSFDDLIDSSGMEHIDNTVEFTNILEKVEFRFGASKFSKIWLRICLERAGLEPPIILQKPHVRSYPLQSI
jgi:hypothetical protein